MQLFDTRPARYFVAQSGWVSNAGAAPSHEAGFVPRSRRAQLFARAGRARAQRAVRLDRRERRAPSAAPTPSSAATTRSACATKCSTPAARRGRAIVYRQLLRNPPPQKSGMTNPEAFSFIGAAWYSPEDKYEKRKYADFVDDGALDKQVSRRLGRAAAALLLRRVDPGRQGRRRRSRWPPTPPTAAAAYVDPRARPGRRRRARRARGDVGAPVGRPEAAGPARRRRARAWRSTLDYGMFTFLAQAVCSGCSRKLHKLTRQLGLGDRRCWWC